MIREATYKDIDGILKVAQASAAFMVGQGIIQWNAHYPDFSTFKNDVSRNELYVIENPSQIIGCVVVSTYMDKEYLPVTWLTPNKNNIYIHRLAVHPEHQGKGYAKKLMDFAETLARQNQVNSIRLDTFSQNKRNQKFYELCNYKRLEDIYFPKQSEHPFQCYELIL